MIFGVLAQTIRSISDKVIKMYTEINNIPGIALFVDFSKAFDTIEWDSLKCYYDEKMLFLFSADSDFIFGKNAPCQLLQLNFKNKSNFFNYDFSFKVLLRSNYRYSFFYIFVYNMTFSHILPNFNPLRTLEVILLLLLFPRIYGRHYLILFQGLVANWRK